MYLKHFGSSLLQHLLELVESGIDAIASAIRVHIQLTRLLIHVIIGLQRDVMQR